MDKSPEQLNAESMLDQSIVYLSIELESKGYSKEERCIYLEDKMQEIAKKYAINLKEDSNALLNQHADQVADIISIVRKAMLDDSDKRDNAFIEIANQLEFLHRSMKKRR